jgi:hypothetical protein
LQGVLFLLSLPPRNDARDAARRTNFMKEVTLLIITWEFNKMMHVEKEECSKSPSRPSSLVKRPSLLSLLLNELLPGSLQKGRKMLWKTAKISITC